MDLMRAHSLVKKYWVVGALIGVLLILFIAFIAGVRVGPGGISLAGTLEVRDLPENARVYLDEAKLLTINEGTATTKLTPGAHSIIVDVEGMQPWNELVELSSNGIVSLSPLQVPKDLIRERLPVEELGRGWAALRSSKLPTQAAPLALNECVSVWVSGGRILASTSCETPTYLVCEAAAVLADGTCPAAIIFSPSASVRSVVAFPGRDDAVVVAAGALSYVIELDPRKPQFFAPLVKASVSLAPWDETALILEEAGVLYRLPL